MTTTDQLNNLRGYVIENAKSYPALKEDIYGSFCLCQDEIADGNSTEHEIEICREDIRQLIETYNNERKS